MIEANSAFPWEKANHKQQFTMNIIIRCNCAKNSNKAIYM